MLLGNFFIISDRTALGNKVAATIDINPKHPIFEGHFPGQPVVPGVCMMQMMKELLETEINCKTQLRKADFLKFLAVINPVENPRVSVEFSHEQKEDAAISVTGRLYKDATTFVKFKGSFIPKAH